MEDTVKEKTQENDQIENRIVDMEVRIGKLNSEKQELVDVYDK